MDFGEVLSGAWKITWKHKVLWIFGILASCGTRSSGGFNGGGSSNFQTGSGTVPTPNLPPGFMTGFDKVWNFLTMPAVLISLLSLTCILVLLAILLSVMGRIGLIKGAWQADEGVERLGLAELWHAGLGYFWRFLGLSLLIGSPAFLVYLVILLGFFAFLISVVGSNTTSSSVAAGLLVFLPIICVLACVLFLFAIFISFLGPQAESAIVIENEGVLSGLKRGWQVLTKNLGPILVIWLIVLVISLVAGLIIALPVFLILVPTLFAFVGGSMNTSGNLSLAPLIVAGLCLLAYIPISWLANGILATYTRSVWTLTYLRLTKASPDEEAAIALPENA